MTTWPRHLSATRYATPLREGGSLPALLEADDDGLYVVKLRGAGQGTPVLIAELICAGLANALSLPIPEVVRIDLAPAIGRNEPDPEIHALLAKSVGDNLGLDYLPGSITFDPAADRRPSPDLAAKIILFDLLVTNPDRTDRNPNLLWWHDRLWLIDHGAALYFQYAFSPDAPLARSQSPLPRLADHVLWPFAAPLPTALPSFTDLAAHIPAIIAAIPDDWLASSATPLPSRAEYAAWLAARLAYLPHLAHLAEEADRGRSLVV